MKNAIVAQSGGPSSVINASLAGVFSAAHRVKEIGNVYGALNGIEGIIKDRIIDMSNDIKTDDDIYLLSTTPSMALGSCRFKLPTIEQDPKFYENLLHTFKKYDIGYFFYIGGNDSMDTAYKLSEYFKSIGEDIKVMGVPKTIDNDLPITDHTPGFASAAKFVCNSLYDIIRDSSTYDVKSVTIVEMMGRNAGWLTTAACIPTYLGDKTPLFIYLPETAFDIDKVLNDVRNAHKENDTVIIAISEGVKTADGNYLGDDCKSGKADIFGHKYLSGVGKYLENIISVKLCCKVRSIELNVLQRSCSYHLSHVDLEEAFKTGEKAVYSAIEGKSGEMITIKRVSDKPYSVVFDSCDIKLCANQEKIVPLEWITKDNNFVTRDAFEYILPLIKGDVPLKKKNGFPLHFKFDFNNTIKK